MRTLIFAVLHLLALAAPAWAADISGQITDRSGGVLPGTTVRLVNVASGEERQASTDGSGRFEFRDVRLGIYRVTASLAGFSDEARTIVVEDAAQATTLDLELELGGVRAEVTVSADRGERDVRVVPLRTDTIGQDTIRQLAPVSTGDALSAAAPGVTVVGAGPFQIRPRLRGLDSTRVLVLVDGERLNNARTATDRAGVEVGLVDPASIENIEVLGGAGSVLYGTDALSGTINIITNRARFTPVRMMTAGFDGFFSSNENGRRGTVTFGVSDTRWAVSFTGGGERFDDYQAGKDFRESSQALFDSGRIVNEDTIDDAFGFDFGAFPDPFNRPFTRTSADIPLSGMEGSSANLSAIAAITDAQTIEVKYQRRHASDIGFPDFQQPFFFQSITLPWSRLDKFSAAYSVTNVRPWMPRFSVRGYYQAQDRLLRNQLQVQFPVPSPGFFPITVFGLNIQSDTRQRIATPGVDVQATFLPRVDNLLTVGMTVFRDRSEDERRAVTQTKQIGQVAIASFRPTALVFPSPVLLGPPEVTNPVRVPDASFRDLAVFVHDEWNVTPDIRVTAGLRVDGYRVTTDDTPGYEIQSIIEGAQPPVDPDTLPDVNGDRISRQAFTGEAGLVLWSSQPVSLFAHYVRSYRHPNLEELLFAGDATVGSIVPNIKVEPETGHNVDVGARFRARGVTGSLSYFNNTYSNFISTEIVSNPDDEDESISQAINFAKVRIQGVEGEVEASAARGPLTWLPYVSFAYNHGTVLEGENPLSGVSLAGAPQDNITPWKIAGGLRVTDRQQRWWAGYHVRGVSEVTRVSPLLDESPFLIAQDLFGLAGFSIHRLAGGLDWQAVGRRLGVTLAVDNLTDKFYREQFQFAPARGRSVTVQLQVRGTK